MKIGIFRIIAEWYPLFFAKFRSQSYDGKFVTAKGSCINYGATLRFVACDRNYDWRQWKTPVVKATFELQSSCVFEKGSNIGVSKKLYGERI